MNDFARVLGEDLSAVFLNPSEHAEQIELDQHDLIAVVDHLDADPLGSSDARLGLGMETIRLYIAQAELPGEYVVDQRVSYNGQKWYVLDVKEQRGLVELNLGREAA